MKVSDTEIWCLEGNDVSEAINIFLESDSGSRDNSIACTINKRQRVAYQGDKIRTSTFSLLFLPQVFRYSFEPVINSQKYK